MAVGREQEKKQEEEESEKNQRSCLTSILTVAELFVSTALEFSRQAISYPRLSLT
jgi:hypothetical protein